MITRSPLATLVPNPRDVADRTEPVFGLVVHTTGSGIVEQAIKLLAQPLEHAVAYYMKPDSYFAHYVIGWDGHIVQIADEKERAPHVGFAERAKYLDGSWEKALPFDLVALWQRRWPGYKSPAHLFPGPSVNNVYVGCELLPLPKKDPVYGLYTLEQHQAVVMLAVDIGERWGLPDRWWRTSRLLGHEDLNPLTRSTKKPPAGWDPGGLRADPWFQWSVVLGLLDSRA